MREELTEALGWTLDRLQIAANELSAALPIVGLRLVKGGDMGAGLRIASATAGSSPAEKAADRIRRDAKDMHRAQATVLWRIVDGSFGLRVDHERVPHLLRRAAQARPGRRSR